MRPGAGPSLAAPPGGVPAELAERLVGSYVLRGGAAAHNIPLLNDVLFSSLSAPRRC